MAQGKQRRGSSAPISPDDVQQDSNTAIVKARTAQMRDLLDKSREQFGAALARIFPTDRFVRSALTLFQTNPDLMKVEPLSFIGACMQAAQLGLPLDPVLGMAYLVPFKGRAQFIPGYRGYVNLAHRSGKVTSVQGRIVWADEEFDVSYGTRPRIHHKPKLRKAAIKPDEFWEHVQAAYCVVFPKDGGEPTFEVMSPAEIQQRMLRNPAVARGRHTAWKTDPVPMAIKTPTRSILKWAPLSVDVQLAVSLDERAEAGLDQHLQNLAPSGLVPGEVEGAFDPESLANGNAEGADDDEKPDEKKPDEKKGAGKGKGKQEKPAEREPGDDDPEDPGDPSDLPFG